MRPLRFVVVGLGGCSKIHLQAIQWLETQGLAELTGVVALEADRKRQAELVHSLTASRVALYHSTEAFLEKHRGEADVLTVPIGIHKHVPVSIAAMRAGLDVYCEKPVAATVQEVDKLTAVQQSTGRKIVVGFQHFYSHSIRQLKARICDGRLGKVASIALIHGWPRSQPYYARNDWTGRLRLGKNWILDSPANNAMAHYLFNLLFLASSKPNRAAVPVRVQAELYRANAIESTDLIQVKLATDETVSGFAVLAHCNSHEIGPFMRIVCENGHAYWQTDEGKTFVKYRDGRFEKFDNLADESWRFGAFRDLIQAIRNHSQPFCTPAFARDHTLTIDAMHESCPEILTVPREFLFEAEASEPYPPHAEAVFCRVKNLDEEMRVAFEENLFFSEFDVPWARSVKSAPFAVKDYQFFPQSAEIRPSSRVAT